MQQAQEIWVLHGPNLNLLGSREPEVYGELSLPELNARIEAHAADWGAKCVFRQSNHEGQLIDWLHAASGTAFGVVANFGAYSHTSVAIRDAISAVDLAVVEVHLSNVFAREAFRHTSVCAPACVGVISGFGWRSYALGIDALLAVG